MLYLTVHSNIFNKIYQHTIMRKRSNGLIDKKHSHTNSISKEHRPLDHILPTLMTNVKVLIYPSTYIILFMNMFLGQFGKFVHRLVKFLVFSQLLLGNC